MMPCCKLQCGILQPIIPLFDISVRVGGTHTSLMIPLILIRTIHNARSLSERFSIGLSLSDRRPGMILAGVVNVE